MAYKSSVAAFVANLFLGTEETPVCLLKNHPEGFLWHTADKWELTAGGKSKRHRSPVFGTMREAVGNCLVWLEKMGVDLKANPARIAQHDPRFEPGRTRSASGISSEMLDVADALILGLSIEGQSKVGKDTAVSPSSGDTGSGLRASNSPASPLAATSRPSSPQSAPSPIGPRRIPTRQSGYTPMTGHDRSAKQ